ncbi:MAG TPA: MFS transporter [Candidatus Polarisedimenticolaceae bacterium]|nr:MFS transporter [Candidatus Polarisedimenticolaceae bacterium]
MRSSAEPVPRAAWLALGAASLGWMLDAFDVMLYAFALTAIRDEFHLSAASAGALASVTLVASAAGGIAFGALADRIGRVRALTLSILVYAVATGLTATSRSIAELVLWRTCVGIGLGGEWSAGSVLVAESWPAARRGSAIGLMQSGWSIGYALAAVVSAVIIPAHGWRALFAVGVAPALLTFAIRRWVREPVAARDAAPEARVGLALLTRPPYRSRVAVATTLATAMLFAYWGLFTWIPTFLAAPVAQGGAGLGLVRGTGFILAMQAGAFAGYTTFGALADRVGRRPAVRGFVFGAAVIVPAFALGSPGPARLWALAPAIGALGSGAFSVFGSLLAELFPRAIRGTAQGLCYNAGRAVSAAAPYTLGAVADARGLAGALVVTSAFYAAAGIVVGFLPETKGAELS